MLRHFLGAVLAVALVVTGCSADDSGDEPVGMANPASVFCEEQGGELDVRKDAAGNETGFCVFEDGTEVEEWAYYHGEAEPALP
jgi:putative hemolysin